MAGVHREPLLGKKQFRYQMQNIPFLIAKEVHFDPKAFFCTFFLPETELFTLFHAAFSV